MLAAGHVEANGGVENVVCFVDPVAGIDEPRDVQIISRPLLDLEETTLVGVDRIGGFFVGPALRVHWPDFDLRGFLGRAALRRRKYFKTNCPSREGTGLSQTRHVTRWSTVSGPASVRTS
jgi:hypothetical protein